MRAVLLALLFASALLSGCTGDEEAEPEPIEPVATQPAGAAMQLEGSSDFGWLLSLGAPTTGTDAQVMATNAMEFEVPEGAQSMVVNATWDCLIPMCAMHFYVWAPGTLPTAPLAAADAAGHAMGDSTLSVTIEAPEAGMWTADIHSDAIALLVSGSFSYVITPAPSFAAASATPPTENQ